MKKVLKWIGIVLGAILGLIVLLVLGLFMRGSLRLSQVYNPHPITSPFPRTQPVLRAASTSPISSASTVTALTWAGRLAGLIFRQPDRSILPT